MRQFVRSSAIVGCGTPRQPQPNKEEQHQNRTRSHRDALQKFGEHHTQPHPSIVQLPRRLRDITIMLALTSVRRAHPEVGERASSVTEVLGNCLAGKRTLSLVELQVGYDSRYE